jgi:hypothetical protein
MEQFKPSYATTQAFDRNISETGSFQTKTDNGYRSPAQWAALSRDEKDKILSARRSKKSGDKRSKLKKDKHKRKLAAAVKEAAESISAITDDTNTTANGTDGDSSRTANGSSSGSVPADQFGRKAHAIKKILQGMVTAATGGQKSA